ncbi:MAG: glucosidase, partial [Nodosilinea sp.]
VPHPPACQRLWRSYPTHSYMKYLYKYPQAAFPYEDLVKTNQSRSKEELEYELLDTGIFDDNRYFDVFVEYAKASATDVLIQVTVANRGPEAAPLHLLPTLWFRNTWSWPDSGSKPVIEGRQAEGVGVAYAYQTNPVLSPKLEPYYFYCEGEVPLLFTENETNQERLFGFPNPSPYLKDGINNYVVMGQTEAVNPQQRGTKVAPHYRLTVAAGETQVIRLRLCAAGAEPLASPFGDFEVVLGDRRQEADQFYAAIIPERIQANADQTNVMRQALAGMLWSKQYFYYDLEQWLEEHGVTPWMGAGQKKHVRNSDWFHMFTDDVISMPDKWEYPWFAAWDLAFHMLPLSLVDQDFAKDQLMLMLREDYLHPNGQIP